MRSFCAGMCALVLCVPWQSSAAPALPRQGNVAFGAGFQRSWASESTLHLVGPGHDLTLHNVQSHDDPRYWDDLINMQYAWRLTYFLADWLALSLGQDHMK